MTYSGKLERLQALHEALRESRPRPDSTAAWFCASALLPITLLPRDGEPGALAASVGERYSAIREHVGRHAAPTGGLRWTYAGLLVRSGVEAQRLAVLRDALRERRGASKTGGLHAGGSRAALVLCAGDLDPGEAAQRFFAMKQALNPPWWRRDASVTDTYAAAHAVRGDDPRTVAQARSRAEAVFQDNKRTRAHKRTAARACVLFEAEPRTVLRTFETLDAVRKRERILRHRVTRSMLLEWTAQGLNESDLDQVAQILDELPRRCGVSGQGRARLAHLVHTADQASLIPGEVSALAAIIAAQTAAIVAATTAVTVATTSASS
ncbi:MAG: hypothetical protein RIA71_15790 [Oceanicaulis sp.]